MPHSVLDLQRGDGNATMRRVNLGWMSSARRCTTIWPLFGPGKQWMFCARANLLTLPFSIRTDPCRTQSPLNLFYKIQWISYGSIGFNGIRHGSAFWQAQVTHAISNRTPPAACSSNSTPCMSLGSRPLSSNPACGMLTIMCASWSAVVRH